MGQNWKTGYFCNEEGQEALYFQFQLILTTMKFLPYVALCKIFFRFVRSEFWRHLKNSFAGCFLVPKGMTYLRGSLLAQNFQIFSHPKLHRLFIRIFCILNFSDSVNFNFRNAKAIYTSSVTEKLMEQKEEMASKTGDQLSILDALSRFARPIRTPDSHTRYYISQLFLIQLILISETPKRFIRARWPIEREINGAKGGDGV